MEYDNYNVIGVMSGTSLDGIDLCYISFTKHRSWEFKILDSKTYSYSKYWHNKLKYVNVMSFSELQLLDVEYTRYLAEVINTFKDEFTIDNIDAVCSHGHTALHQPDKHLTLQIGNLSHIAQLTNETVVCDFRVQDVNFGGQGAPLVPVGDKLLFGTIQLMQKLVWISSLRACFLVATPWHLTP